MGVLALQGAFEAHLEALARCDVKTVAVRVPDDLDDLDGIVLPGGESTTMSMMLERNGLASKLGEVCSGSLPVFGTCAGLILLASEIVDGRDDQIALGLLDAVVVRNGYGRQVASTEVDVDVDGLSGSFRAVYIRAPRVTAIGDDVEVLASRNGDPVLLRSGAVLASAFHPELSGDDRLHEMFVDMCAAQAIEAMMNDTTLRTGCESACATERTS
ncbi:MAG: pyridoxal 5'-phosphate synthase glutaminase subunit PdxT [Acidobacteria bacterium]|nr:pyridoxal 5'-phosphate synthase glutaminase subunit PdxT [Acidobacteriota bacterium]